MNRIKLKEIDSTKLWLATMILILLILFTRLFWKNDIRLGIGALLFDSFAVTAIVKDLTNKKNK